MASTLAQGIHEWLETLPLWQQDLARRVCLADDLDEVGRGEVLAMVLGEPAAPKPVVPAAADFPAHDGSDAPVELTSMGDFRNVNRLATGQTLRFAPGLNVVYGDTGAGKSGHARVLRRLCRSAVRSEVLPNVFGPAETAGPRSATITARIGIAERTFNVNLADAAPQELSSVSVFDAACARTYIERPNAIDFVPGSLVLFDRMVRAQDEMADELRQRIASLTPPPLHLDPLVTLGVGAPVFSPGTEVGRLIADLSVESARERVVTLAHLDEAEAAELQRLLASEREILADESKALEQTARRAAAAATNAFNALSAAFNAVSDDVLRDAGDMRVERDDLVAAQQRLATEALGAAPIPGTGNEPWKLLWESARQFAVSHDASFPDAASDARCELCQQTLETAARQRMQSFEAYIQNNLETRLSHLRDKARAMVSAAPPGERVRELSETAGAALSANLFGDLAERYQSRRGALVSILSGQRPALIQQCPALDHLVEFATQETQKADAHARLRDERERRTLLARLSELRDRQLLSDRVGTVIDRVSALEEIATLDQARRQLDTRRISVEQRRVAETVVTADLRQALSDELERLTADPPRIKLATSALKGQTVVRLEVGGETNSFNLGQVLSDGEQRALSTAFFLAELRVSTNCSAIVLDDPVTSLDQSRREYVAARLVEEAKDRQVVIFTHDLAFLLLLQDAAGRKGEPCHGQWLRRAGQSIGVVNDSLPFEGLTARKRLRSLRRQLQDELQPLEREGDLSYAGKAEHWCSQLRQAWEQTIEEVVLNVSSPASGSPSSPDGSATSTSTTTSSRALPAQWRTRPPGLTIVRRPSRCPPDQSVSWKRWPVHSLTSKSSLTPTSDLSCRRRLSPGSRRRRWHSGGVPREAREWFYDVLPAKPLVPTPSSGPVATRDLPCWLTGARTRRSDSVLRFCRSASSGRWRR